MGLPGAVNTYQWNLIKGLDKNLSKPIDIINILPVGIYPKYFSDLTLRTKKWSHFPGANDLEIGFINVPFLKHIKQFITCKTAIKKWLNDNGNDKKSILIYTPYLPFLLAVNKIPDNVNVTLIVTDIPQYYDLNNSSNKLKKYLRLVKNFLIYKSIKRIDSFVVLTQQMEKPLSIDERRYVVIEGIIDEDNIGFYHNKFENVDKKTILYTGALHSIYGVKNMIDGFRLIEKANYELWICGSGEAEKEIINASKIDKRIKYFGYVSKKEIYELQQKATVVINPRTNDGEYNKYSFPSKTMEYMLSGKPVLMYKLDGVPDEYDQYLYYINGSKPKDIADRIMEVCEKPQSELNDFGQKARQFVLENKSSEIQAKKIIDMIRMMN